MERLLTWIKENKRKSICIIAILYFIIPIILSLHFSWGSIPYDIAENLLAYYGTMLSGLTGGALTLGGVWWTIRDQDKKRDKDIKDREKEQKEEDRKRFMPYFGYIEDSLQCYDNIKHDFPKYGYFGDDDFFLDDHYLVNVKLCNLGRGQAKKACAYLFNGAELIELNPDNPSEEIQHGPLFINNQRIRPLGFVPPKQSTGISFLILKKWLIHKHNIVRYNICIQYSDSVDNDYLQYIHLLFIERNGIFKLRIDTDEPINISTAEGKRRKAAIIKENFTEQRQFIIKDIVQHLVSMNDASLHNTSMFLKLFCFNFNHNEATFKNSVEDYDSPTEKIMYYKMLLDSGIITSEEFEAKKKQLLGL